MVEICGLAIRKILALKSRNALLSKVAIFLDMIKILFLSLKNQNHFGKTYT